MKSKVFQWFDLPFFDDVNDFQFDEYHAKSFIDSNSLDNMRKVGFV